MCRYGEPRIDFFADQVEYPLFHNLQDVQRKVVGWHPREEGVMMTGQLRLEAALDASGSYIRELSAQRAALPTNPDRNTRIG